MNTLLKLSAASSIMLLSACATQQGPVYGNYRGTWTGAALGAAGGALVGHALDKSNGAYLGAATGALLGGGAGYMYDRNKNGNGYYGNSGYRQDRRYEDPNYGYAPEANTYPYPR